MQAHQLPFPGVQAPVRIQMKIKGGRDIYYAPLPGDNSCSLNRAVDRGIFFDLQQQNRPKSNDGAATGYERLCLRRNSL